MNIKQIAPIILTGVSVIASIAAVFMAANDTPKVIETMDNHRLDIDPEGETDLSTKEKVIDCAKGYWKTEALLGVSITASVAACVVSRSNYRALLASTAAISAAYGKYRYKVKNFIGEEKEKLINQMVKSDLKKERNQNPNDRAWFYDTISDTYFEMTWKEFWDARLSANRDINTYGEISLGHLFPRIEDSMEDKNYANHAWFVDDILENYGYPWLDIDVDGWNLPGSENADKQDSSIRSGKPTWVIHYGIWPLPPSIAKDYQWIS